MGQLRRPAVVHPPVAAEAKGARATQRNGAGQRVYDHLRRLIRDGTLAPGAPVPSTRAIAADLGASRTTVTAAYEQLTAEGFIVTAAGRVARVAQLPALARSVPGPAHRPPSGRHETAPAALSGFGRRVAAMGTAVPAPADAGRVDFLYGAVAATDFPALAWRRAYQARLLSHQPRLDYAAPEGEPALRQALQGYLRRARGLGCDAAQIVVVNGAQQAIDLCARLLLDPGDAYAFEDPGYPAARRCFDATGAVCRPTPVDEHGIVTDLLPEGARLAYVTPSHQFPLGGVLPVSRRAALLHWARQQQAWVIEDDYDGEFRYGQRPIDALQSMDGEGRVIYIGTFSKALSPQLRLGYLVLPCALVPAFTHAKRLADRHAPLLEQLVLADLIDGGVYERHVRRMRRENERRRTALLDAAARHLPPGTRISGTAAGLHVVLWLALPRGSSEATLLMAARGRGVGIHPLSPLFASGRPPRARAAEAGFMLGYASLSVAQIGLGIRRLGEALAGLRAAGQAACG